MSSSATKPMVWFSYVCGLMDSTHTQTHTDKETHTQKNTNARTHMYIFKSGSTRVRGAFFCTSKQTIAQTVVCRDAV